MQQAEYLRINEVQKRCGNVSKATIYRWSKHYGFPEPIKLGPNTAAWPKDEIENWLQSRPRAGQD